MTFIFKASKYLFVVQYYYRKYAETVLLSITSINVQYYEWLNIIDHFLNYVSNKLSLYEFKTKSFVYLWFTMTDRVRYTERGREKQREEERD